MPTAKLNGRRNCMNLPFIAIAMCVARSSLMVVGMPIGWIFGGHSGPCGSRRGNCL